MKRISWKKGMRLTDEVFRMSDACTSEQISNSMMMAAAGRFGLFPQCSFGVSIDIKGSTIDVVSIDCLAVTRDGSLIDVNYDSSYNNTFNTSAAMPQTSSSSHLLVSICVVKDRWCEVADGLCEPVYAYIVTDENTPIPSNGLPIARLVSDGGAWRVDEEGFVPPCLFVSSHSRYMEMASNIRTLLQQINTACAAKAKSAGRDVLRVFWPVLMQTMIAVDKELVTMTPMQLLGNVQKCVGAFAAGFALSDQSELPNAETYLEYAKVPYNYKEVLLRLKQGISLLNDLSEKVSRFGEAAPKPAPAPAPEPQRPAPRRWSGMSI